MYMACVFDVVFHNNDSHWCEMFDEEDILEAEYGEDIDSYWVKCIQYHNILLMISIWKCPQLQYLVCALERDYRYYGRQNRWQ